MSLKNAKSPTWSITTRIAVLYTALATLILALATGSLYWMLENNIENADRRFLNDKIAVLKSISSQDEPEFERLKEEVQWEVEAYQFNRYYARVLDADGTTIIETPRMSGTIPGSVFAEQKNELNQEKEGAEWRSNHGQQYLLMSAPAIAPDADSTTRTVQVALNITSQKQILENYLNALLIVLLVGILLSAAAGAWVARKGMQPLAEITDTVKRISASKLQDRTHPARWPSELTTLAEAFDNMLDRLEASFNQLRQFSADLAHELRTPINNLMGETEVALSKARTADEYQDVLESNLEEYNRLSQLIKNLLFLAEADYSDVQISRESINAREAMETIIEFYEVLASERAIQINLHGHTAIPVDQGLFRRAVSNILSNAIQYAPDHSKIDIALSQKDGWAHIIIEDEGPGIDRKHISKLFDRFYRVDASRSSKLGGTGLGLPIVKSIMDLHGGGIDIRSRAGAGTKVILAFPHKQISCE